MSNQPQILSADTTNDGVDTTSTRETPAGGVSCYQHDAAGVWNLSTMTYASIRIRPFGSGIGSRPAAASRGGGL